MSDLIQEYRESTACPSQDGWQSFYDEQQGLDKIDVAASAVASNQNQAFRILKYILEGSLK